MNTKAKKLIDKAWIIINGMATLFVFLSSWFLYYKYATREGNSYRSDILTHIRSGRKGGGYTLLSKVFYWIIEIDDNMLWIGLFLALTVLCTIFVTYWAIKCIAEYNGVEVNKKIVYLFCVMLIFVCNIYVPDWFPVFYKGTACTQSWHNPTYMLMRAFAVPTYALYLKIEKKYLEKIDWKDWVLFVVLLTLGNWSKPSFLIAFAPMMLVFLIYDFLRLRSGKDTIQMIKFGTAVLLSLPVCFYQASTLWKEGSGNGVTLKEGGVITFFEREDWVLYIVCGLLFPILVMVVSIIKNGIKNKLLIQTWTMFLISWLTPYIFTEFGKRSNHGNFGWGRKICGLLLFIVSFVEVITLYKKGKIGKVHVILLLIPLIASVICGIVYYVFLLSGRSYYI